MAENCILPKNRKPNIINVIKGAAISSLINFFGYTSFVLLFYGVTIYYFNIFNIEHKGIPIHTIQKLMSIPILKYVFGALIGLPFESIFVLMLISGFSYYLYNTLIYDNLKNFYPYTCDSNSSINEDDGRYKKIIFSIFKFMAPFGIFIGVLIGLILFQHFVYQGLGNFKFILYLVWVIGLIMTSTTYFAIIYNKIYYDLENQKIDSMDKNNNTSSLVWIFTLYSIYLYSRCVGFRFNFNSDKGSKFSIIKYIMSSMVLYIASINLLYFIVNFIQGYYIKMWHVCNC
jgi:hypothetical protein